jgi:hypothetical protein
MDENVHVDEKVEKRKKIPKILNKIKIKRWHVAFLDGAQS